MRAGIRQSDARQREYSILDGLFRGRGVTGPGIAPGDSIRLRSFSAPPILGIIAGIYIRHLYHNGECGAYE